MAKKPKQQCSVRLSQEHISFINAQPGKDFSAKLTGLINFFINDDDGVIHKRNELNLLMWQFNSYVRKCELYGDVLQDALKTVREFQNEWDFFYMLNSEPEPEDILVSEEDDNFESV